MILNSCNMIAEKLKTEAGVRVIAPARSLGMPWITQELKNTAIENFKMMWLKLSFSEHVNEIDDFNSSSIQNRISDIHDAFRDTTIQCIITAIGGFSSNQLLKYLDYNLIKSKNTLWLLWHYCSFECNICKNLTCHIFMTALYFFWKPKRSRIHARLFSKVLVWRCTIWDVIITVLEWW